MLASRVELDGASADLMLERLRMDPQVEYVALDRRRFAHATNPNDALFGGQWYLKATEVSAVNAINAWDEGQGTNGVVVAVLDTGVLYDHPDLGRGDRGGKLLPGFDFVSGVAQANDDFGRDADPSDPGDWVSSSDQSNPALFSCEVSDSSWHGTRVAGMIGALTNNTIGVAGLSWNSFILPVRVLGKCGGTDSDIIAGMRWAAGLHIDGVADNPTPARILNLSLGATSPCEPSYLDVIQELTARKVLVVISAGNEGTVVSSPANCPGVAAIAAIRHAGSKVGFSNLGPEVTIAAPGGNCVNINGGPCLFSLDTTSNSGTTNPASNIYTDQTNFNLGTSFSAPIVSGIAALMLSRNNNLSTNQMLARLREGARPFPTTISDTPNILTCHLPLGTTDIQTRTMPVHDGRLRRRHGRRHQFRILRCAPDRGYFPARIGLSRPERQSQRLRQCRGLRPERCRVRLDSGFSHDQSARHCGREYCNRLGHRPDFGIDHLARDRHRRSGSSRCRGVGRRAQSHHFRSAEFRGQQRLRYAGHLGTDTG